jgi:uncharacterized membrane protein
MVVVFGAVSILVLVVLVGAPLTGWPAVVRLPAVLVPALVLAVAAARPWRWLDADVQAVDRWQPGARAVWASAIAAGLILFWIVLTRFQSGEINAVDFTVYFDRPCSQTSDGRLLFVETSDDARFSNRSELTDHAYWAMLPICSLYAVYPTPYWLLAISVLAVVLGAVHAGRIVQYLGGGGLLSTATALAFVLNDNTARTLNYGFHPEVLYAWFIPWMIEAGLRGRRRSYVTAAIACILVKESACLSIFAATTALGLIRFRSMTWTDRAVYLALPNVIALANLGLYYGGVVPRLTEDGRPTYAYFWENYGATPIQALLGMVRQPWEVLFRTVTSGFFTLVILPHLFLPLIGWRWMLGTVPLMVIFGTAAAEQVRAFGIYYAIPLVPFLVIAASAGALTVARQVVAQPARARLTAAAAVLLGALLVGSSDRGYSLRPWKQEIAAVPEALAQLSDEPIVLVQSGLFPHAGYDQRFKLLTRETLRDPRNARAPVLVAPGVNAYPFEPRELENLVTLQRAVPMPMPTRLFAVRRKASNSPHIPRSDR